MAIALVGLAVGTATGATTPFQQVIVVNPPASPVPVSVTNQVATQTVQGTVSVNNFPATQEVSGTVNVGNFPTTSQPLADQSYVSPFESLDHNTEATLRFASTMNVTTLILDNVGHSDSIFLSLIDASGRDIPIRQGDGSLIQNFTLPVPARGVVVNCVNTFESCDFFISAFGS